MRVVPQPTEAQSKPRRPRAGHDCNPSFSIGRASLLSSGPMSSRTTYLLSVCLLLHCAQPGAPQKTAHFSHHQALLNAAALSKPANQHQSYHSANMSRPIERPSLQNSSLEQTDSPSEWLMMGGGDLLTEEGKSVASVAAESGQSAKNATIKRSGYKRKNSHNKSANKTVFDDEQSEPSDSSEVYDDVEEGGSGFAGTQKEPECASQGRYYCTYKEDYPLKQVTEVTKYYKWPLEKLFRDLHAQIMPKLAQDSTGNLVCDSITRVVRPGWARNTNDRWLVVINTDNYHQYVTEVVCQYGSNSRCNFIPPCYYSSCQQRYNTQKLLVIDPSNPYRGPFLSEFLFPSCCVCYVPSASDTFQDKYRSSPATIYQRTMQQEAASNLYPPQFRPAGLMEEPQQETHSAAASRAQPSSAAKQAHSSHPASPGEIRRGGDQYKRTDSGQQQKHEHQVFEDFPRLGLSDSLVSPVPAETRQ